MQVTIEKTQVDVAGSRMDLLVALPPGEGRRPGILLSHYKHGLASFTYRNAERLASEGFVVVAPDHYHYCAPDAEPETRSKSFLDTRLIADMQVATSFLRSHARVIASKTAIMGHCMGGRQAILGAATIPGFCCAIDCYGGGIMKAHGEGPSVFDRLSDIHCPVAGFFGANDKNPPIEHVRKLEAELMRLGVPTEFHVYSDTGHAFMDPEQRRYVQASADDAWRHILDFLRRNLCSERNVHEGAAATA